MKLNASHSPNVAQYMRILSGKTIAEVSSVTGLSLMTISRIERGNFASGIDKLQTLARNYGITVDALVRNDLAAILHTLIGPAVASHKVYDEYLKRAEQCNKTGIAGEDWVFQQESEKLRGSIYEFAVNPNYSDEREAHHDMLSFDAEGNPIVIEVKATTKNSNTAFCMTVPEINRAKECLNTGITYEIHRVHHVDNPNKIGRDIIGAAELFSMFEFTPTKYSVERRSKA